MFKLIFTLGGFFFLGLPGLVIGFIVGSVIDRMFEGGVHVQTIINNRPQVSPADFELNLLSLCSIVIKADGTVNQNELQYVRNYFIATYGKDKANAIFRTFNEVVKDRLVSAPRICAFLNQRTRYEVRLQLLHFLFGIANADGSISDAELQKIREIAGFLRVYPRDFSNLLRSEEHTSELQSRENLVCR